MRAFAKLRAGLAYAIFGGGSVVAIALRQPAWPFLDYRMYSGLKAQARTDWLALEGTGINGQQINLLNKNYWSPFTANEIVRSLAEIHRLKDGEARLQSALTGLERLYESDRNNHFHSGPQLHKIEVYHVQWLLKAGVNTIDTPLVREHILTWEKASL